MGGEEEDKEVGMGEWKLGGGAGQEVINWLLDTGTKI